MKISLVMPQGTARRTGNHHTAQRWAGFLRQSGHRVRIEETWAGKPVDALIALHARKSAPSVERFHHEYPDRPLIVALTGTDLYRDIDDSADARRALEIATRLIVLQPKGRSHLSRHLRPKTRVIFQSSDTALAHRPAKDLFRLVVVGNLRDEKDPFRAAAALAYVRSKADIELLQIGAALSPEMEETAIGCMRAEPRYRWVSSKPHRETLSLMAQSHLLIVSSVMEGGANVICEAARIGMPVLASRVSGNVGMLGTDYAGYYPLFDERKLARLIDRVIADKLFHTKLMRAVKARRALFAPSAERAGLAALMKEVGRP